MPPTSRRSGRIVASDVGGRDIVARECHQAWLVTLAGDGHAYWLGLSTAGLIKIFEPMKSSVAARMDPPPRDLRDSHSHACDDTRRRVPR